MGRFVRHLIILVYKHLLIKLRKPFQTIIELSFPIQLVVIIWLFTTFGINLRSRVEHMPTNVPEALCTTSCGKQLGMTEMAQISSDFQADVKEVATHLENVGISVKKLDDVSQYMNQYKSLSGGLIFAKTGKRKYSYGDALVIANRTDVSGNQTLDYVQGGLLHFQQKLHEAYRTIFI
jgi:hypothetical protein